MPEIAAAVADALAAGRSVRGALAAAVTSLEGPPAAEMARLAADLVARAPRPRTRSPGCAAGSARSGWTSSARPY